MQMIPIEMQIKPFILLIILVCLVSLNIIFIKTNESIGNKREVVSFRCMLLSYRVYALVDFRLLVGDDFYTMLPRPLVLFIISVGFATMSFSCYFWFMHVSANMHLYSRPPKIGPVSLWKILVHIPLGIILLILFTPLHTFTYVLTDTIAEFKPGIMMILLLDYVYLIAATAISIRNSRRAKTKLEKKKFRGQTIFIIFFTISGILIGFLLNLPAIELVVIPVVLKLFVDLQDSQIYTDALTKLYNRRRMTEFISEEVSKCSADKPFSIIMIDMDYFKSINDILGHDEGDKALISFANSIRKMVVSKDAVAARWGGDEFIIAGKDKELATDFRERLTAALKNSNKLEYQLPFSVGIYQCTSPNMTCEKVVAEADSALYKDKEIQHEASSDFIQKLHKIKDSTVF